MQSFGGLLLVAVLFSIVALGTQFWRTTEELNEAKRSVEGYQTLIEGLYAYRADNVLRWPTSFTDLTSYLPLLQIDIVDPMQAGTNGEGGRYVLMLSGRDLSLVTTVSSESHARRVVREFGTSASYATVASGYAITVVVPDAGGIALMQQTLLIDGTNKMQRPLWIASTVAAGDACSDTGMALDAIGNLMRCVGGVWQTY